MGARKCSECGRSVTQRGRFCGNCGALVSGSEVDPTGRRGARAAWRWFAAAAAAAVLVALVALAVWTGGDDAEPDVAGNDPGTGPSTPATDDGVEQMDVTVLDHDDVPATCVEGEMVSTCPLAIAVRSDGAPFGSVGVWGALVVAVSGSTVTAVDVTSGQVRWQTQMADGVVPQVLEVDAETVLVQLVDADQLVALDVPTGARRWTVDVEDPQRAHVVHGGTWLVVVDPSRLVVYDVEASGVRPVWSRDHGGQMGPPVVVSDLLITIDQGELTARRLFGSEVVWSVPVNEPADQLAIVDGLVTRTTPTRVVGYALVDGRSLWELHERDVRHLQGLSDGRFATWQTTTSGGRVLINDARSGQTLSLQSQPAVDEVLGAGPGLVWAGFGTTWRFHDIDTSGPTWQIRGVQASDRTTTALHAQGSNQRLATVLEDAHLLAVFDVNVEPRPWRNDTVDCPLVRTSEAMGDHEAWRGERVHLALVDAPANPQLFVGFPDHIEGGFTISARLRRERAIAGFFAPGGTPQSVLRVEEGQRSAPGWPQHWALLVSFPSPGCWDVEVSTSDFTDIVQLPVPASHFGESITIP